MYIKKILIAFFLALVLLSPSFASAQGNYGADVAADKAGLKSNKISKMGTPAAVIGEVINVALSFIGIVFFILMLYAGFTWMTAMGSSEQVTKAKDIIETAIIGLVLVGAAYAIASFVFDKLGAGSGGGTTPTTVDCTKAALGATCGDRKVCDANKSCVDKCMVDFVGKNPQCVPDTYCPAPKKTETGLCSDPKAEIKCCHD